MCEAFLHCQKQSKSQWLVVKGALPSESCCKKREVWNISYIADLFRFLRAIRKLAHKRTISVGSVHMGSLKS